MVKVREKKCCGAILKRTGFLGVSEMVYLDRSVSDSVVISIRYQVARFSVPDILISGPNPRSLSGSQA